MTVGVLDDNDSIVYYINKRSRWVVFVISSVTDLGVESQCSSALMTGMPSARDG